MVVLSRSAIVLDVQMHSNTQSLVPANGACSILHCVFPLSTLLLSYHRQSTIIQHHHQRISWLSERGGAETERTATGG